MLKVSFVKVYALYVFLLICQNIFISFFTNNRIAKYAIIVIIFLANIHKLVF